MSNVLKFRYKVLKCTWHCNFNDHTLIKWNPISPLYNRNGCKSIFGYSLELTAVLGVIITTAEYVICNIKYYYNIHDVSLATCVLANEIDNTVI